MFSIEKSMRIIEKMYVYYYIVIKINLCNMTREFRIR